MAAKGQPRCEPDSNGQTSKNRGASRPRAGVGDAEDRAGKDNVGRNDQDASRPPDTAIPVGGHKHHRGKTDIPHGGKDRLARWPARAAEHARDEIRRCAAADPAAASDAAWAVSDTLHAAAGALGSRELRRAADSYARAARVPYGRTPRPTPAGASLRQAARLLSRAAFASQDDTAALAALILQLAALVETVIELRQAQRHAAQASAARCSAGHLRTLGRRLNRRRESPAAMVARLTAESFPVPPWAAPRASGWCEPAADTGPRPRRGTGPPRQCGPSR